MNENSIDYDNFINPPHFDKFGFPLKPEEVEEKNRKEFLEKDAANQAFEEWKRRKEDSGK
jgi:hypothetical protein